MNTKNVVKGRRFIVLKNVEQINDYLFIDTQHHWWACHCLQLPLNPEVFFIILGTTISLLFKVT